MPWYVLWALPFAALSRSRLLRGAVRRGDGLVGHVQRGPRARHRTAAQPALTHTSVARANTPFEKSLLTNPVPVHPHAGCPDSRAL